MAIDISKFVQTAEKDSSFIFPGSIRIENNELIFVYSYLSHLPNPFDSYYDTKNQELYVLIQQDTFPFGSTPLVQKISLPKDTKSVSVDYRGHSQESLTTRERIEYFFPKLRLKDKEIED